MLLKLTAAIAARGRPRPPEIRSSACGELGAPHQPTDGRVSHRRHASGG
jgi:hypothetical protein